VAVLRDAPFRSLLNPYCIGPVSPPHHPDFSTYVRSPILSALSVRRRWRPNTQKLKSEGTRWRVVTGCFY
jgi:hypothetical protein